MTMELLSPAGGMEQLRAAVRFGADAVYGGLARFGLRAGAGNFTWAELETALAVTRAAGKKFYLTLNILPYDDELDAMCQTAARAFEMGVNAAIVSDIGAFLALRARVPALDIHISTQANVMNAPAACFFGDAGAKRVILSRELSLARIAALRAQLPEAVQIEAFAHGAMCMAHSGRCMMSDHMAGRGGNRGACAQPCRWQYTVTEIKRPAEPMEAFEDARGTYIFSAYDLNMLAHLPEMRDAGVSSVKIEGRMKTGYYVATVTRAYRRALDLLMQSESAYRAALPSLESELLCASHRKSNTGFYFGAPRPSSGAEGFYQTREFAARVLGMENGRAILTVKNRFEVGDMLEALTPSGVYPFAVESITRRDTGESVPFVSIAGQEALVPCPVSLEAGDYVRGPNRNHRMDEGQ